MDDESRTLWETNRSRKRRPKQGYAYCISCDRALVPDGAKCSMCGSRNDTKRYKKVG